jgi:hypothetical protein
MALSKNNNRKNVFLRIGIVVCFVILIVGLFLWMKTWKTYIFPDSSISISYPTSDLVVTGIANSLQEKLSKEGSNKNIFISLNSMDKSQVDNKGAQELAYGISQHECSSFPGSDCKSSSMTTMISGHNAYIVGIYNLRINQRLQDEISVFIDNGNQIYELDFNLMDNNKLQNLFYRYVSNDIINSIQIH